MSVLVWGENVHEHRNPEVAAVYPEGMHEAIAAGLREAGAGEVQTATLQDPDHGLTVERLAATEVLVWWGHLAHDEVDDAVVDRVQARVLEGMGLVVLHSGHFSKPFKRLLGTSCSLRWREDGRKERLWVVDPGHPIAAGLGDGFEVPQEEMYGEPFGIPAPDELVFISWFVGGEVFRSGATWRRGAGRIFYFRPGHETFPTYRQAEVRRVIANGVEWARPSGPPYTEPGIQESPPAVQDLVA